MRIKTRILTYIFNIFVITLTYVIVIMSHKLKTTIINNNFYNNVNVITS